MARDEAYRRAEAKIEKARREGATSLHLGGMGLSEVPESLGQLTQLQTLNLSGNQLTSLSESLGQLTQLTSLYAYDNQLTSLPECVGKLISLDQLHLDGNHIKYLPKSISSLSRLGELVLGFTGGKGGNWFETVPDGLKSLTSLRRLYLDKCRIKSLPTWLLKLTHLADLSLDGNPLNPELAAAYKKGWDAVKEYLRAQDERQLVLHEAKLILIGEGEVGKTCLIQALRGEPWQERESTHGIEIHPVEVAMPSGESEPQGASRGSSASEHIGPSPAASAVPLTKTGGERAPATITLNAWDFGGQKVYRPTHQLFFSAPAVYLVVWKPREGPQQGAVEYWIKTIKHRAGPRARVLVVATHGGPTQRLPDISEHELREKFGADTVVDFYHVDSKPDDNGQRRGIEELKDAIARVAAGLPHVGREVPASWARVLDAVRAKSEEVPYVTYQQFCDLCRPLDVSDERAALYASMLNELGHVIHYGQDEALREVVILKPDWLAKAISFVLDDRQTRDRHGLVDHDHLGQLWSHPPYKGEEGYAADLHPLFRRLMERFDLSYEVVLHPGSGQPSETSLIAQLMPDKPLELPDWEDQLHEGDEQRTQVCRIVEVDGNQSASAEGLFYRLIVRLHKYSLGRGNYEQSVHWQRGLLIDDGYNGRALLRHVGNDVHITVRAAYPERFIHELTREVQWLVDSKTDGWPGLRCDIMVPCIAPCGRNEPGRGLFEVEKLIIQKHAGMDKVLCPVPDCSTIHDVDALMRNAPVVRPARIGASPKDMKTMLKELAAVRQQLKGMDLKRDDQFRVLQANQRRMMSQADEQFAALMQTLTDEARDGPRLFSFEAVDRSRFNPRRWTSEKFRITLWCEHARLPLTAVSEKGDESGIYELELTRDWVKKAAPYLKGLSATLSLVLPVASSATQLLMDDDAYDRIAKQLDFGQKCAEALLKGGDKAGAWLATGDDADPERGEAIRAHGSALREFHALLKAQDPAGKYGGLVRVQNKRREFLWVHPKYQGEY